MSNMTSSSIVTGNYEFFKLVLNPHSSNRLKLPVDFVRNVKCQIPTEISLIGPSRNVWKVQLVQVENDYFFEQGWSEFVVDNHMKNKDFCLFEYVEENKCQVMIFDSFDGCEREAAFHAVPSQASSSTPDATTSKGKGKAVEDEGKENAAEDEGIAEPYPGTFASQRRDITDEDSFVPSRASSSTPFEATTSKGKEKAVEEDEGKENTVEDEGIAEPHTGPFVSQRRDITDEDSFIALDAALGFESKNPSTLMVMQTSHVYTDFCVSLPISFCKVILPPNGEAVTVFVRDPHGRAWHVEMAASEDGLFAQLSTGWRDLSYTNNIEANDVCIFELVKEDELQLHIFRVVEEIKPLISCLE
ncbi:hypothetical protein C5167_027881 [Papaver somniferum]|uniref:B3 domain-containing protein Os11g0197600-like n=1 Tax=Papaver somniferum TaxID=3469 RepID=UPI000E6FD428|nr:B3 domain-containing protein Os11g0197600-like [Papaver somniferum]RZC91992.1 hypothetical protein C5167_027881 [Papaver somniferum]